MSTNAAHKRWWQIFEVIFGVPFLAGIGLQFAAPVSRPRGLYAFVIVLGGAVLVVTGLDVHRPGAPGVGAAMASRPTPDFLRASSSQQVSFRSRGILSTSAAFAFWQGLRLCSISRGHWFFSSRPSSPATTFS